jgi:pseudouridine-5'-phosphate glycosidase
MSLPTVVYGDEVGRALAARGPVVALESTVLAHGVPWPHNLEVGLAMEAEVRRGGATPATIAVLDGRLHVGLEQAQLECIAREQPPKGSRRDLGVAVAAGASAATTVAGTLAVMQRAGLRVLATGGIGGVHRDAHERFDVSADLLELARVPSLVVCAGAKVILDLPRTLELLETLSVPVIGWRTDEFPAFYVRSSGLELQARVETAEETARAAMAHWQLGGGGVLVTAPIPEAWALAEAALEAAIGQATEDARRQGVRGAAVTPFLLRAVADATEGRSVEANVALLRNNAGIAAQVAAALVRLG